MFGFPVTPFRPDLSLDLDALARNVDEMASYPFCAMVSAGGTGELYSLSVDEIEQVIATTVEAVSGRMPVVAGTGFNVALGADIARRAEKVGLELDRREVLGAGRQMRNAPVAAGGIGECDDRRRMQVAVGCEELGPDGDARIEPALLEADGVAAVHVTGTTCSACGSNRP